MSLFGSKSDGYKAVQNQLPPGYTLVDEDIITEKLRVADRDQMRMNDDIIQYKAFKLIEDIKKGTDLYTTDSISNSLKKVGNSIGLAREHSLNSYHQFKYATTDLLEEVKTPCNIETIFDSKNRVLKIYIKNPNTSYIFSEAPNYTMLTDLFIQYILAIPPPTPPSTQTQGGKSRRRRRKRRVSRKNRRSRK
jgi:hypothetical protein